MELGRLLVNGRDKKKERTEKMRRQKCLCVLTRYLLIKYARKKFTCAKVGYDPKQNIQNIQANDQEKCYS